MRIFFVGLTGSGKSTLARQLAHKLSLPFVDLDDYIIEKEKKTISQIFADQGEAYFRQCEADAIRQIVKQKDVILATGGGAACFHDNMTVMNVAGVSIFLNVPVDTLAQRLWNQPNRENRPMIAGKSYEQLVEFLNELYAKRVSFYQEAKLIIEGASVSVSEIIEKLNEME